MRKAFSHPLRKSAGPPLKIVFCGLSITSSWGNGHATTYRALMRGLVKRGHDVLFLERDRPWYASHRDLRHPPYGRTKLYNSVEDLRGRFSDEIRNADAVILGSYVTEGADVGDWILENSQGVTAFYDMDTPITLELLEQRACEYLRVQQIPKYDIYFSFTGGPTLQRIEKQFHSPHARALYCSVDPEEYRPQESIRKIWELGYLGTYSEDRQEAFEQLFIRPARRYVAGKFVVAGAFYPSGIAWPDNVERIEHLPPPRHSEFYNGQRFTLNLTRRTLRQAGYSPSARLFEAAAAGTPIISDRWPGLDSFFQPDTEILVARDDRDIISYLIDLKENTRKKIGEAARRKVLLFHSAEGRAAELERMLLETLDIKSRKRIGTSSALAEKNASRHIG